MEYLNAKAKAAQLKAAKPLDKKALARSVQAVKVVITAINEDLNVELPV